VDDSGVAAAVVAGVDTAVAAVRRALGFLAAATVGVDVRV
jgi:hypothetical protein